jgi:transcriptional regulator with XRE-family HTH domain
MTGRKYLRAIATTLLIDNNRHVKILGMRLAVVRRQCGMTQEVLAKKARLSPGYIARLEIGMHDPSVSTLLKLAKAMKVQPAELLP